MEKTTMNQADFGMGILAALRIKGIVLLDEFDIPRLHSAFVEAFKVIEPLFGRENLKFWMTTNRLHGDSQSVHQIMYGQWLGVWATKDSGDTIWRIGMQVSTAEKYLTEYLVGDRDMWLKAADAFLAHMRT